MVRKLTDKQAAFVAEYLVDLNATQAAIRAGYSERTAYRIGAELLQKTSVAEAIAAGQAKRAQRVEITADRVVAELAKIAFADPRDLMEWGPDGVKLKASAELTEEQAASVAEVSETTTKDGGSLKLKKHDKVKALELLGRHMGMFKDKVENEISGGLVITWQE
ncbi:terminase small subunit [uncultured Desulfovibrio sp.]|uniref:terminase small subunit n=1 Tax=uncultured Desulfovibrio sp. TaxID=167968 RepID=UPI0026DC086C|nr:terminase small subunit [uncultured Desulfovibrio sp.]